MSTSPTTEGMMLYATAKPEAAGVYLWRIPSSRFQGLTVEFCARMRERNAGYKTEISPSFDHWDGYRLNVPAGTEWAPAPEGVECKRDHEKVRPVPVGVEVLPCPFCHKTPTWKGVDRNWSGIAVSAAPHEWNVWWLECCRWGNTPHGNDPRELAKIRNNALRSCFAPEPRGKQDATCRRCLGQGTIEVPDEVGPGAHPMDLDCPVCRGTGAIAAEPRAERQSGWLVERRDKLRPLYVFFDGMGCFGWTPDPNSALRFARKLDADNFSGDMTEDVICTEHLWCDSSPETLALAEQHMRKQPLTKAGEPNGA